MPPPVVQIPRQPYHAPNAAQALVVGTASLERYTQFISGRSHQRIGGVAATIAQELHRGGHQPFLYTAIGDDTNARLLADRPDQTGIRWQATTTARPTKTATFTIKDGEAYHVEGEFPIHDFDRLDVEAIAELLPYFPYLIVDSDVAPGVTDLLARTAHHLIIVASAPERVANITGINSRRTKTLVACNELEAALIAGDTKPDLRQVAKVRRILNAKAVLVTHGAKGWNYLDQRHSSRSKAPSVPSNADFIGAGDAAAAGAIHAMITGQPVTQSINAYIGRRLAFTAELNR